MTAIAVVDDHALLANALADSLQREGFDAVGIVPTPAVDVEAVVADLRPDVVLLDLDLGACGPSTPLIPALRALGAKVIVVTGETSPARLGDCIESGADGVLSKAASFETLLDGVKNLIDNLSPMSPGAREQLLARAREQRECDRRRTRRFERLTARERDVLDALMDGLSAEEIAAETYVSMTTVRSHIRSVLQKLEVKSQLAAVALAIRCQWQRPSTHT
jgi:two-component system nitrate/nitrite response regulator NarL